jgi:hypothetical protein
MLRSSSYSGVDRYVKVMTSYLVHVSCIRTPVVSVLLPAPSLVCFLKYQAGVKQLAGVDHVTAIIMGEGGWIGSGGTSQERVLLRRN